MDGSSAYEYSGLTAALAQRPSRAVPEGEPAPARAFAELTAEPWTTSAGAGLTEACCGLGKLSASQATLASIPDATLAGSITIAVWALETMATA